MPSHIELMIPGASASGPPLEVTAPYNQALLATLDTADAEAVERALTTAYGLFRDRGKWLSKQQRISILQKTAQLMSEQRDQLALAAAEEGGKPLIDSLPEVDRAIDGVHHCIECLRTAAGHEIPMGINTASENRLAMTRHEPVGVVVAISAFNHPLNLIVHQVGPAIASGCPVIVKPAEDTPLSCFRFVELLREAGLPDGWCQPLVVSELKVATQLVTVRVLVSSVLLAVPGWAGCCVHNWHRVRVVRWNTVVPQQSLWPKMPIWKRLCQPWPRAVSIMPARCASRYSGCIAMSPWHALWQMILLCLQRP
jgi:delta 1-pyrroline-5-carboxylate dehydrogenase